MEKRKIINTYQGNRKRLNKVADLLLKYKNENQLRRYIMRQREENQAGMINRLIDVPDVIPKKVLQPVRDAFKDTYIHNIYDLQGETGITTDETEQYDGIIDMALLTLVSNRLKNIYSMKVSKSIVPCDSSAIR